METNRVKCKDCYYYDQFSYLEIGRGIGAKKEDGRGLCRRFGPVTSSQPSHQVVHTRIGFRKWVKWIYLATFVNKGSTIWPSVIGDFDWCGEFKHYLCDEKDVNPYFLDPTDGSGNGENS